MIRILIVDDEAAIRLLCVRSLQSFYDVVPAENAEQALARFDSSRPDLVVCDIGLPGMSGLELIGRFRAVNPTLPVLIVTGKAAGAMLQPDEEHIAFLAKPFGGEELREAVAALLHPKADSS
jgi:two-component system, OmpR family, KDP operon response regulator KdpE